MVTQPVTCPSESTLNDFGAGKLDAAGAETVSRHLETCTDCRQRVASLPSDRRVAHLHQAVGTTKPPARRERTYVPGESLAEVASSTERSPAPEGGPSRPSANSSDAKLDRSAGQPSVSAPAELANDPDYELIEELGQGGMGTVYLARNHLMGRLEVFKVISDSLLDQPGALERFQQEIRSAAKLAHPNIVAAYRVLRPGKLLVFAMEYVAGQDLAEVVNERGPLPVANATFYIHQVALGLQHAHEKGMVHRDIKPNNLMLGIEGKKHIVKILDFGLAKATSEKGAETGLTKSGQMLGTPDYVAPEQTLDAQKADIRADIYSLGCTLYFLLSGGPPFPEASLFEILRAHHEREPRLLDLVRPDVPEELAAVVVKMMAKDPARRYQTPGEVAKALVRFFKPGQSAARPADGAPTQAAAEMALDLPLAAAVVLPIKAKPPDLVRRPPASGRPSKKPRKRQQPLLTWQVWAGLGAVAAALLLVMIAAIAPKGSATKQLASETTPRAPYVLEGAIPYDAHWYWFSPDEVMPDEAAQHALRCEGHLVIIATAEENAFLAEHIKGPTFIGMQKTKGGIWKDLLGRRQTYFNWDRAHRQPSSFRGQVFAGIVAGGGWHDYFRRPLFYCIEWDESPNDAVAGSDSADESARAEGQVGDTRKAGPRLRVEENDR